MFSKESSYLIRSNTAINFNAKNITEEISFKYFKSIPQVESGLLDAWSETLIKYKYSISEYPYYLNNG